MSDTLRQTDRAYEVLKDAILSLELPPGTALSDGDIVERFNMGRTPFREATQRLAAEGLVTFLPRRGTMVSSVSPSDVKALYEVRLHLEPYAASLAAERASDEEVAEMEALLHGDVEGWPLDAEEFDKRLHESIARAAHNKYLSAELMRLYAQSVRLLNVLEFKREGLEQMQEELGSVVKAIRSRDPEAAAAAAYSHMDARNWFDGGER